MICPTDCEQANTAGGLFRSCLFCSWRGSLPPSSNCCGPSLSPPCQLDEPPLSAKRRSKPSRAKLEAMQDADVLGELDEVEDEEGEDEDGGSRKKVFRAGIR